MAEVKWIKLYVDMFEISRKLKSIENITKGDTILIIWIKLLLLAGRINDGGAIYITPEMPYNCAGLASELRRSPKIVKTALDLFEDYGMIYTEDGIIYISSWEKYQNIDGMEKIREQTRERVTRCRQKKKCSVTSNATVTQCNETDKDKEIDKDIYTNRINKESGEKEPKRKRFSPPTLEEVRAYCFERENGVDAERFINYYTSNGWRVGKNMMKDWKAAVRSWERNGYSDNTASPQKKNEFNDFMSELASLRTEG